MSAVSPHIAVRVAERATSLLTNFSKRQQSLSTPASQSTVATSTSDRLASHAPDLQSASSNVNHWSAFSNFRGGSAAAWRQQDADVPWLPEIVGSVCDVGHQWPRWWLSQSQVLTLGRIDPSDANCIIRTHLDL